MTNDKNEASGYNQYPSSYPAEHRVVREPIPTRDGLFDPYRPNHFYHDNQGDPNTCQHNHNHPVIPNPEKNGFGIAAMILGPVALLLALVPFTAWLGIIAAFTGICLALAGLGRVRKNKASNKKTTIAALVVCTLAIVACFASMVVFFNAVDQLGTDLDTYGNCIDAADTVAEMDACS